jgi:hypothetical protein
MVDPKAEPMTWAALRDAGSAAQLAVQMLAGPLAPWNDPDPERVREALRMLEDSTRRINALVAALTPTATTAASPVVVMPVVAAAVPRPAARPRKKTAPASPPSPDGIAVARLLRDVELALLAAPAAPRVAIHAGADLVATGDAATLVAILVGLVEDAAAVGPPDAVVELRAFADLADAIGDEMDVVFEIRPDARAGHASAFAPRVARLPEGARLEVHGRSSRPRACLRVAAARRALILAA